MKILRLKIQSFLKIQFRSFTANKSNIIFSQLGSTFNQRPPWASVASSSPKVKLSFDNLAKYIPFVSNSCTSTSSFDNKFKSNFNNKELELESNKQNKAKHAFLQVVSIFLSIYN